MKLQREFTFRLSFLLLITAISVNSFAQSDPTGLSSPTRTYAITNATIVPSPGKVIEEGTIIIKNGLIIEVGTNVSIPTDAEEIDGTDLFVYPGFIDGMSYTGAKRPEPMERPRDLNSPEPPNDYAGITPENSVISQIDISDNSIKSLRSAGFTISHSVPYGRMLPGSGSILLLSDASHADNMILSDNVSMYTQFSGAPGAYPGNTLGIMAKWRNLYINAKNSQQYASVYEKNPAGLERPSQDRVLEAFYPVVAKEKPVFYNAGSLLEAQRAIRLKKELNFELAIGNLEESWDLIDQLKESNTTVFMSLDLPTKPKDSKEKDKTEEVIGLEMKRMAAYKTFVSQYAVLDSLGIQYGFSTMDVTASKIKGNLETIIEAGLSEDAALAALTINAAKLLGIDKVTGTLETGKIGNAVISTGPYFEKDSKVKMMFVDGNKYELEVKETKKGAAGANSEGAAAVVGSWSYTSSTPQGEQNGKITIERNGDELTGIISSDMGIPDSQLNNLSFLNGTLSFDYGIEFGGQLLEIVIVGDVSEGSFNGEASVTQMNISWPITATKDPAQN